MSNSSLIPWIETLLFGAPSPNSPPPENLRPLLLRMEAERIPWSHQASHGGLTAFPYQVHGDLNYLLDVLETRWEDSLSEALPLKTRAVTKFWQALQLLLARRADPPPPVLPPASPDDDALLQVLLSGGNPGSRTYQSAGFWGEVARRFIQLNRPEHASPLPPASAEHLQRILTLYDSTCVARGQTFDPWTLCLVHHSEYVNAAHWQTPRTLEAFMQDRPTHPLTRSVQALLRRSLTELLHGLKPSALLQSCDQLDALLHNLRVIHASVPQVPTRNTPPKLIDTFQRLLALCHRDGLWESVVPEVVPIPEAIGTSLFHLTERLRIAEREQRVLWKHLIGGGEASAPEPQKRTCSDALYANRRPRR